MMARVLPGYSQVVEALTPVLDDLPGRVVAIDGRDGVGKTTLGRHLAWHFNVSLVETDLFLVRGQGRLVYRDEEIARVVRARLDKPRPVIVEGVSVLRLLQRLKVAPDFVVYVRDPSSGGGERLDPELAEYEKTFAPASKANLVVDLDHEDS
jgi:uridine kinase